MYIAAVTTLHVTMLPSVANIKYPISVQEKPSEYLITASSKGATAVTAFNTLVAKPIPQAEN